VLFARQPLYGVRAAGLATIFLILIICDYRGSQLKPLRAQLSFIVAPIQYLADWPTRFIDALKINVTSREALLASNKTLRAKQLVLESQLQQMHALEQENQQLRALLNAVPRTNSQHFVAAQLLAITSDLSTQQMVLDKGSNDGVYLGQAVIDADGIMGQVVEVNPVTSRVLLISDPRSGVPIQNSRNGWRGIVAGKASLEELSLLHVPQTADVKVGDLLISSGLGQRYPAGYPVGRVKAIVHYSGEHFTTVSVTPSAHLNSSTQVLLIWPEVIKLAPVKSANKTNAAQKAGVLKPTVNKHKKL
jgi:rod shape-determining protein MreC